MSRITLESKPSDGVRELLRHLLDKGKVSAVLAPRRLDDEGSLDLGFITDRSELDSIDPFAPVMIANTAQVLSMITPSSSKIAVVLKPCELRGFVERVKREQGTLDNILTISCTCGGVFPLQKAVDGITGGMTANYYSDLSSEKIHAEIRETCKACEHFIPINSDVTVSLVGEKDLDENCQIYLNSKSASELLEGLGGEIDKKEYDPAISAGLMKKRLAEKERLFNSVFPGKGGIDAVIEIFGKCVGCHGCSRVCPICYCVSCDFESMNFDSDIAYYEKELSQKGALRLPPDTMLFHIGRMIHMSFSCVGCGLCSDVCPADIPVASVFKRTGDKTASIFDYIPGRDLEEAIPVMVFKEEEFSRFVDE
ncbi:MAG: 4Fe-4S dicluster domain-containing protein [Candidatus Krumholzibacteriota bacterium]|nr:4Fe-4S dicluster domain-containing protein [Candidatus Krumholzibacteriota bacterium]